MVPPTAATIAQILIFSEMASILSTGDCSVKTAAIPLNMLPPSTTPKEMQKYTMIFPRKLFIPLILQTGGFLIICCGSIRISFLISLHCMGNPVHIMIK
jgi:hypothetical protein